MPNTRLIGKVLYTDYIFPFELAGLVLLVAIIAAVSLTVRQGKDSKRQRVSQQVKVRREDRVRLVKMPTEQRLPEVPPGNAGAGPVDGKA